MNTDDRATIRISQIRKSPKKQLEISTLFDIQNFEFKSNWIHLSEFAIRSNPKNARSLLS